LIFQGLLARGSARALCEAAMLVTVGADF
jgi:hypothetical protein